MPQHWLERFPSAAEIVKRSVEMQALQSLMPDDRLIRRRKCEFEIFKSVEEAIEGSKGGQGFWLSG
jgi:hypothetical protein